VTQIVIGNMNVESQSSRFVNHRVPSLPSNGARTAESEIKLYMVEHEITFDKSKTIKVTGFSSLLVWHIIWYHINEKNIYDISVRFYYMLNSREQT